MIGSSLKMAHGGNMRQPGYGCVRHGARTPGEKKKGRLAVASQTSLTIENPTEKVKQLKMKSCEI
jgi:hypothetical protein